ncbi:MAG TPA: hypothetical protein VGY57_11420, partial [Vicinamibacterales bacterium]|nr:hypothetical protein [Vicinamibacterales bacterium]
MSVHFTRELSVLSEFALDYKSDQGNRNMYLRDDRGNRYDSVATEGAARTGGRLEARSPLEGSFTFPAPAPGARTLVFYDDDAHVKLEGLRLDPAFVADSPHQQLLRSLMRAADRIELRDAWSGLSAAARPVASHSLRKAGDAWIGDVTFSVSERSKSMPWTADNGTVAAFLDELAGSRLTAAPYVPTFTHTDDYPDLRIEIGAGGGGIEFHTTSQGPDHVPWALDMSGRTLSVPVATPMRAMERLLNTLDKAAMQRLVDELQRDVQR